MPLLKGGAVLLLETRYGFLRLPCIDLLVEACVCAAHSCRRSNSASISSTISAQFAARSLACRRVSPGRLQSPASMWAACSSCCNSNLWSRSSSSEYCSQFTRLIAIPFNVPVDFVMNTFRRSSKSEGRRVGLTRSLWAGNIDHVAMVKLTTRLHCLEVHNAILGVTISGVSR